MATIDDTRNRVHLALDRLRSSGNLGWSIAALCATLVVTAPLVAIVVIALRSSGNTWPHLLSTVLPSATLTTILLMAGVGLVTLTIVT
ncbi:MAG: hypothetical protein OEM91_06300, partial [Hyphomicrobiales bacterium]|nr:hypothetical protein [Hyphomicrobiales bacterium]